MSTFKDILEKMNGWLRSLVEFGVTLILAFVVVDILFPGTTGVVENVGEIVGHFAREGVVGLIALLIFLLIYRR